MGHFSAMSTPPLPGTPGTEPAPAEAGPTGATPQPGRTGVPLLPLFAVVAAVVYAADQLSKGWALDNLEAGEPHPLIGTVIQLRLIYNAGAALSIGTGVTWLLTVLALGVVAFVVRAARRLGSLTWALTLGLLLGGAAGNLYDRLFRPPSFARGHVVDFIDYHGLFIGNVADIAIVLAAGVVMLLSIRGVRLDGTREPAADRG